MDKVKTLEELSLLDNASFGKEDNAKLVAKILNLATKIDHYKIVGEELIENQSHISSLDEEKIREANKITLYLISCKPKVVILKDKEVF